MAEKERKDDAEEEDTDAEEQTSSEAPDKGREEREAASEEDAPAEGESKSLAREDDEAPDDDEAAKRVAKALGVDDDDDGQGGEAAAKADKAKVDEAVPNRSARRREEALERRKKRKGEAPAKQESEDEPLPKDKNARAKELLKRRREQAASPRSIQLLPGEMVDDALARSASAAGKWFRKNFSKLQWVILAALAGVGAFALYTSQTEKKAAAATDALFSGVSSELGRVLPEDKRSEEEKEIDSTKIFKTNEERTEAALAGYRKTIAEHPGTVVAQLAKLGEAGVLLDKRDWAGALEAYSAVLASKIGSSDVDVKGRATEGVGLAKEGKGDLDGALAAFKDLEGIDARGYKELGLYQQGRILLAKGETDKAKELLKQAREKLQAEGASAASSFVYLQTEIDQTLRQIDPTLALSQPTLGGSKGNTISPDDRAKIQKLLDDAAKNKPKEER